MKWDGAAGTYFVIDPKEDMFVVLMVQTPRSASAIQPALKRLVYDAMEK